MSEMKNKEDKQVKKLVIVQEWMEYEPDWFTHGGYTIHPSEDARKKFIEGMMERNTESCCYSPLLFVPFSMDVPEDVYETMLNGEHGTIWLKLSEIKKYKDV